NQPKRRPRLLSLNILYVQEQIAGRARSHRKATRAATRGRHRIAPKITLMQEKNLELDEFLFPDTRSKHLYRQLQRSHCCDTTINRHILASNVG
ncbi:MAG: hypothetical protein ACO20X_10410, partial [Alphaproteobacteria bacterium]